MTYVAALFAVIGIIDKLIFKDKFGYGPKFEEGIMAMGTLALSMAGIMCIAPVLGKVIAPVISPVFKLVGADPAMISGIILAIDTGGYPLAQVMTTDPDIQILSGIYVGSMMGATIVFSIPVSLSIVKKENHGSLSKGFLAGFISTPVGALIAALVGGIALSKALVNLIPLFILAILLAVGMALIPNGMLKGFAVFSKIITVLIYICFGAAIVEALTGFVIIPGMAPLSEQLTVVGEIGITLAGAYPLVHFITTVFNKPLSSLGKLIHVNAAATGGMIAALANNIPMFSAIGDMDDRGQVLATAFSVCAAFALGDHLGYATAQCPDATLSMIVGKIAGGIFAILIASILVKNKNNKDKERKTE